jgi:hypothetical protein
MKKIFIFGTGIFGEKAYSILKKKYRILGFLSNFATTKDKKKIKGIKIFNPSAIKDFKFDKIYIASMWSFEIKNQLIKKCKINKSKIFIFSVSLIHNKSKKKKLWLNKFKTLIKILNINNIPYYLDHSSLLGLIRDNDIYCLGDIDLSIDFKNLQKVKKILLKSKIFKKIEIGTIDTQNNLIGDNFNFQITIDNFIDLIVKKKLKDFYYWIVGSNILRIKVCDIKNKTIIRFKRVCIKIPKNYNLYLSILYGKDWKNKNDNWTYDDYKNIFEKIKFKNFKRIQIN